MNIMQALKESASMDYLEQALIEMFKSYDGAVERYKEAVIQIQDLDTEDVLTAVNENEKVKLTLAEIITNLNRLQILFEKLNYSIDSSSAEDTEDLALIKQLEQFSAQALRLIEGFDRSKFPAFVNQLGYLTSLAETHYNNAFGDLRENLEVTPEAEEKLEETEEYLDSLPKIKTNDIK